MNRVIIFLIRRRLGLKKYEFFQFDNQKSDAVYYFSENSVMKQERINNVTHIRPSSVSLNWLLDDHCKIKHLGVQR